MRRGKNPQDLFVVVLNATPVVRPGYRVGVPQAGFYQEALNTDSAIYGGSNVGNMGGAQSAPIPQMGRQHSIILTLPPLAATFLKWLPS
jgi:1,4-alpha-glucan branching enzyme